MDALIRCQVLGAVAWHIAIGAHQRLLSRRRESAHEQLLSRRRTTRRAGSLRCGSGCTRSGGHRVSCGNGARPGPDEARAGSGGLSWPSTDLKPISNGCVTPGVQPQITSSCVEYRTTKRSSSVDVRRWRTAGRRCHARPCRGGRRVSAKVRWGHRHPPRLSLPRHCREQTRRAIL